MPYFYGKKTMRKTAKKVKRVPRKKTVNLTRAIVKSELSRRVESKRISTLPTTYTFRPTNATMSAPIDIPQQFLQITQGAADGQRVGESIMTKKAILKCIVIADSTAATQEPCILQLFLGFYRQDPGTAPNASALLNIFDAGSTTAPADGTPITLLYSINSDGFRILNYKQIKISQSSAVNLNNNDFPAYRKFGIDITKYLGNLKYQPSAVTPTNKHLYLFCNWVNPLAATSSQPPTMHYYLDYTYTDM